MTPYWLELNPLVLPNTTALRFNRRDGATAPPRLRRAPRHSRAPRLRHTCPEGRTAYIINKKKRLRRENNNEKIWRSVKNKTGPRKIKRRQGNKDNKWGVRSKAQTPAQKEQNEKKKTQNTGPQRHEPLGLAPHDRTATRGASTPRCKTACNG